MMTGNWLEAYIALSKAYCYLSIEKRKNNEHSIDEIIEKIKDAEHKIYELSRGSSQK